MNILPKKRWHVKNKDNAARVEADETLFRKKKNDLAVRSLTQEARVDYLRKRAHDAKPPEDSILNAQDVLHLFADIEGNRNLYASNKEYEEELKKEKETHEKKLGILKYLVESDGNLAKVKPWWSEVPKRGKEKKLLGTLLDSDEIEVQQKQRSDPLFQMKKVEAEFARIREVKQTNEAKERAAAAKIMSSCSLFPDDIKTPGSKRLCEDRDDPRRAADVKSAKKERLEILRAERLVRERAERDRAALVLCRSMGLLTAAKAVVAKNEETVVVDERHLPFNSAFNPELSTLAAERRNAHRFEVHRKQRSFK
ncbi:unnamed protein product [Hydatigera taeniaeformis]|uniref:Cir_N domain-containing protein n=1 Tax=Hydatigena taeniaeformis TaxID=6205 RepID=A0A0R3X1F5_HYDTA|nr:unnamed protein product [Hydatigera taeniaeformis]